MIQIPYYKILQIFHIANISAEHLNTNVHIICLQGLTRWRQIGTSSQRDVVEHLLYRGSEVINAGGSEVKNADVIEELICYLCHPRPSSPTLGTKM